MIPVSIVVPPRSAARGHSHRATVQCRTPDSSPPAHVSEPNAARLTIVAKQIIEAHTIQTATADEQIQIGVVVVVGCTGHEGEFLSQENACNAESHDAVSVNSQIPVHDTVVSDVSNERIRPPVTVEVAHHEGASFSVLVSPRVLEPAYRPPVVHLERGLVRAKTQLRRP